jgi:hypothetical protein
MAALLISRCFCFSGSKMGNEEKSNRPKARLGQVQQTVKNNYA